jgi:hypothetical protein
MEGGSMQTLEQEAETQEPPTVRRLCPYCKDDLRSEPQILCAGCFTPHHKGCFSENRGCCLLGCGSKTPLSPEEPAPDAPVGVRRLAGRGIVLLLVGLATGWLLETKQNSLIGLFTQEAGTRRRYQRECRLRELMTRIAKAQEAYRKRDPNGEYASSWEALAAVSSQIYVPHGLCVRVCATHGDPVPRHCAIAVPAPIEPADSPRTAPASREVPHSASLTEGGVGIYLDDLGPPTLDEAACRIVGTSRGRSNSR